MSRAFASRKFLFAGVAIAALVAGAAASGGASAAQTVLQGHVATTTSFIGKVNLKKLTAGGAVGGLPGLRSPSAVGAGASELFRSVPLRRPGRMNSAAQQFRRLLDASMPAASPLTSSLSATGFTGLTHADQRLADNGNQFSLEPPDQALAVNGKFVLESVNNAIAVYDAAGKLLAGPVAMNRFFNQPDEINRTTGQQGPSLSDPRAFYDSATGRWFVVEWATLNDASGNSLDISVQFVAVSTGKDPTGNYFLYHIETTNAGIPGCPCLPDYQQIGFDKDGMYITHNFFSLVEPGEPYVGANIYALSKAGLEAGKGSAVVQFPILSNDFTVHPTVMPPGGASATSENGTEYLVEGLADLADDGTAAAIRIFAISGTASLATSSPSLTLGSVDVATQAYAEPIPAVQPDGPRPLADTLISHKKLPPVPLLDGGTARVAGTPLYVGGDVVAAIPTGLPATTAPTKDGAAWFDISVTGGATTLAATVNSQGMVAAPQQTSLLYPTIAMPTNGIGGIGVTLVGTGNYPSTAVIPLDLFGTVGGQTGGIQITGIGALPDDGFTAYAAFGGNGVGRWGDYGAAGVDPKGTLWFANEYIPDTATHPRTSLANWGTYVTHVKRTGRLPAAIAAQ